jgi:hypothetical protein
MPLCAALGLSPNGIQFSGSFAPGGMCVSKVAPHAFLKRGTRSGDFRRILKQVDCCQGKRFALRRPS